MGGSLPLVGEQLVTRERPHSSGREREGGGRLLEEKQAVQRHGRAGGAVWWRQLTLCGAATLPPIFAGCSSDLSQEERWVIKDPQTFDPSSQKHKDGQSKFYSTSTDATDLVVGEVEGCPAKSDGGQDLRKDAASSLRANWREDKRGKLV